MGEDLKHLFDVGELTSAQREAELAAAQVVAKASNDVPLQGHIAGAYEHERRVRDLESAYQTSKDNRAQYVEELQTLDPSTDRQVKSIYAHVKNTSEAAHIDPEVPNTAKALLDQVFPRGVRAITGQPYPEQNRLVKDILAELQGPSRPQVVTVGATGLVDALAALSAQYDEAIQRSPGAVPYTTLVAAQGRAHLFMLEVVARVLGMHFNSEVAAQVEARRQVTSVLFRELDTAADRRRTRAAANRRRREKAEDGTGDDGTGDDSQGAGPDGPND